MPKFVNAQHLHFPTRLPKAQAFEAVRQIEVAARFARTKCSELHQLIAAGAHDDAQTHIETLLNSPQFVLACIPRAARNFPLTNVLCWKAISGLLPTFCQLAAQGWLQSSRPQKKQMVSTDPSGFSICAPALAKKPFGAF